MRAARQVGQPIFFSTAIIVVAFIPLFTMTGVPGKIFAPMSITYGFALFGALLMAFTLAPVLCSFFLNGAIRKRIRGSCARFAGSIWLFCAGP